MNPIAKMALGQLIKFMREKNFTELKVFINSNEDIVQFTNRFTARV